MRHFLTRNKQNPLLSKFLAVSSYDMCSADIKKEEYSCILQPRNSFTTSFRECTKCIPRYWKCCLKVAPYSFMPKNERTYLAFFTVNVFKSLYSSRQRLYLSNSIFSKISI